MRNLSTLQLTTMALLVAIGEAGSSFLWFPAGIAKAYPVQHAVNVIAAVLLGPGPAVLVAVLIGIIRNLLGSGTLVAFPGAMIGAFFAGLLYRKTGKIAAAAAGEVVGTGILGSLASVPVSALLMGKSVGVFAFIPPFLVSSLAGAILATIVLPVLMKSMRSRGGQSKRLAAQKNDFNLPS